MVLEKTLHLYLDSDLAVSTGEKYKFSLQPSIESFYGSKTKLYLKDFRAKHTIGNFRGSLADRTFTLTCFNGTVSSSPQDIEFEENTNITKGEDFAQILNNVFDSSSTVTNERVHFDWDEYLQKMKFKCVGTNTVLFQASTINTKFLKFNTTSTTTQGVSRAQIDLCREIHNLFVYSDEVTPEVISTANEQAGIICKVPIDSSHGGYIDYQQTLPIHRSNLDKNTTNSLTISFKDDGGVAFFPNRFTITLCIELYKDPTKHELKNNYLSSQTVPLGR